MKLRLLRWSLAVAGLVWGASVFGVFLKWTDAADVLEKLGATTIAYDPMLNYWLRMTAGAFSLIGCWFVVMAIWPVKFRAAIPLFGWFMILEGVILLIHGLKLNLKPLPFYADCGACLMLGILIVGLAKSAKFASEAKGQGAAS